MSTDPLPTSTDESVSPTSVRHLLLVVATLMSVLLYLDRFAVNISSEYIREDLGMTQTQMAWFISAFFWSYALCQVPAGWMSDRFGGRMMLTFYILAWSTFTGLMGVAHAVWMMLWLRLFCGAAQAGAYPTAVGIIRNWHPVSFRGTASSIIALGGRFGGVLAPILTAWLIVYFVSARPAPVLTDADIMDGPTFVSRFDPDRTVESKRDLDNKRHQFVIDFMATLGSSERETLISAARAAETVVQERATAKSQLPKSDLDLRDWIPRNDGAAKADRQPPKEMNQIVKEIAGRMTEVDFIHPEAIPEKLPNEAKTLLNHRNDGPTLTSVETVQLNRLLLESLFPAEIRKAQGPGWHPTVILYGIVGIVVALLFAGITRNHPKHHPWCNHAEKNYIHGSSHAATAVIEPQAPPFPWRVFLTDISLWGNSGAQFMTNFGWFFVVSSLPRYLSEVHHVPFVTNGIMTAFPSGIGIFGLLLGGRCTDWAVRRFGLKWGRLLPLTISRFTGAAGHGMCLLLGLLIAPDPDKIWLPWLYVVGLCLVAGSTDFGTPSIWAYSQDVGGRYTASILGWGNMWGNLGAAVAPLIYNRCLGETPTIGDWNNLFALCGGALVLSGLFAMLLDATKPLSVEQPTH